MTRRVAAYSDEWADTPADPDRLARLPSLVDAPDEPDPRSPSASAGNRSAASPVLVAGPSSQVEPALNARQTVAGSTS